MAEPFAVALHAAHLAGELLGKRVLVTGCGPIGLLAIIAARRAGALVVVATDLQSNALAHARAVGADTTINSQTDAHLLSDYSEGKGYFDVLFECSGAESALVAAIATMRPLGTVIQLGLSGDMSLPMMKITAKELRIRGSFRFHPEFALAVSLMRAKQIDLKPLVTHSLPLNRADEAFQLANDRSVAMKTQLLF